MNGPWIFNQHQWEFTNEIFFGSIPTSPVEGKLLVTLWLLIIGIPLRTSTSKPPDIQHTLMSLNVALENPPEIWVLVVFFSSWNRDLPRSATVDIWHHRSVIHPILLPLTFHEDIWLESMLQLYPDHYFVIFQILIPFFSSSYPVLIPLSS